MHGYVYSHSDFYFLPPAPLVLLIPFFLGLFYLTEFYDQARESSPPYVPYGFLNEISRPAVTYIFNLMRIFFYLNYFLFSIKKKSDDSYKYLKQTEFSFCYSVFNMLFITVHLVIYYLCTYVILCECLRVISVYRDFSISFGKLMPSGVILYCKPFVCLLVYAYDTSR